MAVPPSGEFFAAAKMVPLEVPHAHIALPETKESKSWMVAGVLLGDGEECEHEVVVCRLKHKSPATVAAHLGTGSTSVPMVPRVAPPAHCLASMRYAEHLRGFGLLIRFY